MYVVEGVEVECILAGSGDEIMMPIVNPTPGEPSETANGGLSKEYTGGWEEYYW